MRMTIDSCRQKIDDINSQILDLLNQRSEWVTKIGELKQLAGKPILDSQREEDVLNGVLKKNHGPLSDDAVLHIFQVIIEEGRRLQAEIQPTN